MPPRRAAMAGPSRALRLGSRVIRLLLLASTRGTFLRSLLACPVPPLFPPSSLGPEIQVRPSRLDSTLLSAEVLTGPRAPLSNEELPSLPSPECKAGFF